MGSKEKKRLDVVLLERGLFSARSRARAVIMAGEVYVNGVRCDKPGTFVTDACKTELRTDPNPYVSRGGQKLAGAAADLGFSLAGKTVVDVGASTGGFTDYALQDGARQVYAVDVGYGQLHWKLRQDKRVIVLERTNARYLKKEDLPARPQTALVDVSFISLRKILPVLTNELGVKEIITLVKPQFEAGPDQVGKNGVVKDPAVYSQVIIAVFSCAYGLGLENLGAVASRLKGPKGNIEYFVRWQVPGQTV